MPLRQDLPYLLHNISFYCFTFTLNLCLEDQPEVPDSERPELSGMTQHRTSIDDGTQTYDWVRQLMKQLGARIVLGGNFSTRSTNTCLLLLFW